MSDKWAPWHPITNLVDLKTLGKAVEELGEAQSVIARCIIQGIDERNPGTGKPNREWLEEEIADVLGNLDLIMERFNLREDFIRSRAWAKAERLRQWHKGA